MNDQPRPVWLDSETIVAINQALIDADQRGVNERWLTWNLGAIVAAWDAAPADATETAAKSIDAMLFARDGGSFTGLDCAETALRALGRPA